MKKYMIYSTSEKIPSISYVCEASSDLEALNSFPHMEKLNHFDMMICVEKSNDPFEMDLQKIVSHRVIAIFFKRRKQIGYFILDTFSYNTSYPIKNMGYAKFGIKNCDAMQCFDIDNVLNSEDALFSTFIDKNNIDAGDILISFKPNESFTMSDNKLIGTFIKRNNKAKFTFYRPNPSIPNLKNN